MRRCGEVHFSDTNGDAFYAGESDCVPFSILQVELKLMKAKVQTS